MSTTAPSPTEKPVALEALMQMPESATLREISEEMAILAAIRLAETASDEGRILGHEEVKRRSAAWTTS